MLIECNQRGDKDFAVYVDKSYAGMISKVELGWVCTHTAQRFATKEDAEDFLVKRERRSVDRGTIYA